MIVIKVELWPFGFEEGKKTLGTGVIYNDGTGTVTRGNYRGIFIRRDVHPRDLVRGRYKSAVVSRIENFPRRSKNAWHLLGLLVEVAFNGGTRHALSVRNRE